jgi:heavy metal sensor kinase
VRFQLTALYVAALGLLLGIAGGLVYRGLSSVLVRATDAALSTEATQVISHLVPDSMEASFQHEEYRPHPNDDPGDVVKQKKLTAITLPGLVTDTLYLRVARIRDGKALALSPKLKGQPLLIAMLAALPLPTGRRPRYAFATWGDIEQMRCLTVPVPGRNYFLQVATPWDDTKALLDQLAWSLAGTVGLFLLLSGVGSWVLVGRAFRPIDEIVTEAERLTADRMSPVLLRPRKHSDDEVGHLADALNGMMTRLYDAFIVQRRFTADASHELRTPLTILQGELELALARERSADVYRETLRSSLEETRRMARIVESLALLARADAGHSERRLHSRVRIAIKIFTEDAMRKYRDRAADKGILLCLTPCPDPLWISGDQDTLELALGNLLDNAITYTPSGGSITIMTDAAAVSGRPCVQITIADTGVGISPDDLPHVFERFYRADRARVNTGGSGLGLAIVQSVMEAHGGSVIVESARGLGTRFILTLPQA